MIEAQPRHAPADGVVQEIKALGGKAVANYDDVALMDGGVTEEDQQALWLTQAGELWRLLQSADYFS